MSSGALSEFLSGKRKISNRKALDILDILDVNQKHKTRLKRLIKKEFQNERKILVNGSQLEAFLKDWVCSAVLHFFDMDTADYSISNIANRLLITQQQVLDAISLLTEMGLLEATKDRQIVKVNTSFTTEDNTPNDAIRKSHLDGLELAARALKETPVDERDFTALVFAGNEEALSKVKDLIRELHEATELMMDSDSKSQVYRLQVQMFPLTLK